MSLKRNELNTIAKSSSNSDDSSSGSVTIRDSDSEDEMPRVMSARRGGSEEIAVGEDKIAFNANIYDETLPYVIISLDGINGGKIPFNDVLKERKSKSGRKTLHNTFLYCFSCKSDGNRYYKVGNTYDPNTYLSKNRFVPWAEYEGEFQILHHGVVLERLIGQYLNSRYTTSEWYHNSSIQLERLICAIRANDSFQAEHPIEMKNVSSFKKAYTGCTKTTVDDYLSLFRVLRDGKLYKLTTENVQLSISKMITKEHLAPDDEQGTHLTGKKKIAKK